jgi:hypothetical protein
MKLLKLGSDEGPPVDGIKLLELDGNITYTILR